MLISDSYFILLKITYAIVRVNLDGVFSMNYDFAKVSYSCKSVAHLGSWILNIYIYWKFGVGNVLTHQLHPSKFINK